MKVLLAGHLGRETAAAEHLAREGHELHIAAEIQNPGLVAAAEFSEGHFYQVPDICDPKAMIEVAAASQADVFWLNQDDALANGVVDEVSRHVPEMLIASSTKESSRIEWDKFDAREIIAELDAEHDTSYNPLYFCITQPDEVREVVDFFKEENIEAAVKPRGLTGGKGVKVMGPHLKDYEDVSDYAMKVLQDSSQGGVLIEEKMNGQEFTIQGLTDGKTLIVPPATYDYPYREDGDQGPGTGGMGSFTMQPGEILPFLDATEYNEAIELMREVLIKQDERGRDFKGVLYGSFFKTEQGLKVVEFNARIGDPEGINMMELLDGGMSLAEVLSKIAKQELREQDVRFKRLASTAIYLVSPDYAYRSGTKYEFELDPFEVAAHGCRTYFASAKQAGHNLYQTVGASRTVALASRAPTPWQARANIHEAIKASVKGPLKYRQDIGSLDYINQLT